MTTITSETLELAALAVGKRVAVGYVTAHDDPTAIDLESGEEWRPHTDITDAVRLAVLLRLDITHPKHAGDGVAAEATGEYPASVTVYRKDRQEQYRTAVTCCAAEIGRRMREASSLISSSGG